MLKALGLVETKGLIGAIEAADAMAKAANVKLIGKEKTNPALITIKVIGEVAAVKASVEAGAAAAQRVGQLVSTLVIARPDDQLRELYPELESEGYIPTTVIEKGVEKNTAESDQNTNPIDKPEQQITEKVEVPHTDEIPEQFEETEDLGNEKKISDTVQEKTALEESAKDEPALEDPAIEENENDTSDLSTESAMELFAKPESKNYAEEATLFDQGSDDSVTKEPEMTSFSDSDIEELEKSDLESLNVHQLRRLARSRKEFPIHGREISKANRQELLYYFRNLNK